MLHGRGADEQDLIGLADGLDERFLVVSLRAPFVFPYGGYTWYTIGEDGSPDMTMFRNSFDRVFSCLEQIAKRHRPDARKLFLFGFSMGTMMSFAVSLTHPEM